MILIFGLDLLGICLICLGLTVCAVVSATLIRFYVKWTCTIFSSDVNLAGKVVLITGSNSGIGKETARYMAKKGARVIMACRTMSTAEIVRDEIAAESENHEIILHHVDLSCFQSIREFCATINKTESKIDILIHNAGYGSFVTKATSVDGIELTMASNHYGPFLMTNLLIDLLKKSAPCRIVVVGSKAHTLSFLDPRNQEHLNPINYWFPLRLYANSKFANLLFTFELARRLKGTGITVNALHPGSIDSEIWRNYPFPFNIATRILRVFLQTLIEGIQTTLYVGLSTSLEKVSGEYFRNCRIAKAHKNSYNVEWQRIMWEESVEIVGLTLKDSAV